MSSLTTISSFAAESLAPNRQAARAKDASRFRENLAQNLANPTEDPVLSQKPDRRRAKSPPTPRSADRAEPAKTTPEPQDARAARWRETRNSQSAKPNNSEMSADEANADLSLPDPKDQKPSEVPATVTPSDPKSETGDKIVLASSDTQSEEPDPIDNNKALTGEAHLSPLLSIEKSDPPQTEKSEDRPIINTKVDPKSLNAQAPHRDHRPVDEIHDPSNTDLTFEVGEEDAQTVTDQDGRINTQDHAAQETTPNAPATKTQIIALSPQARSALLNINKNSHEPTYSDPVPEGKAAPSKLLDEALASNFNPLPAALHSQARQNVDEPILQKASDFFQSSLNETSKPDALPSLLTVTLDQNTLTPITPAQASPPFPAATGVPPHASIGRMSHLPVPYARVPMEIGLAALDGQRSIQVRLSPADLGTIDIELDVSDQSEIHARIAADDPRTLAMLKQDAPLIRQALEQTGHSTTADSLSFSLRQDSHSNNRQNQNGQNDWEPQSSEPNLFSDQSLDARPAPPPLKRITSLLDMNI